MPKHTEAKPAPKSGRKFLSATCLELVWSEKVPKKPGWYWRRDGDYRNRIVRIPDAHAQWPTPWKKIKALTIAGAIAAEGEAVKDELMAIPDDRWRIEWAGPIPPPKNP